MSNRERYCVAGIITLFLLSLVLGALAMLAENAGNMPVARVCIVAGFILFVSSVGLGIFAAVSKLLKRGGW